MSFFMRLRKFARLRIYFGIAIIGLLFCIGATFGIVSSFTGNYIQTTATITKIEESYVGEDYTYTVYVTYTDENGTVHEAKSDSYTSGMKENQVINIKYDPSNPDFVRDTSLSWLPYAFAGLGAAVLVSFTVLTIIEAKRPLEKENEFDHTYLASNLPPNEEGGEEKDYIFHLVGKVALSFVMETKEQVKAYEAHCDKVGVLVKPNEYTFTNHLSVHQEHYQITNTVTTTIEGSNALLDLSYHFKINGENCWDHLGRMGYALTPHLDGVNIHFDVSRLDKKVASIDMASLNDVPGAKQYPWGNVPSNIVLKVRTRDCDLEGVFFACFCIAKK